MSLYHILAIVVLLLRYDTQAAKTNFIGSDFKYIDVGIPQGSILSPLFFIIWSVACLIN